MVEKAHDNSPGFMSKKVPKSVKGRYQTVIVSVLAENKSEKSSILVITHIQVV
jgi:hypothetical protein